MVTVRELQSLLRARGLPVSGKKAVLIQRLQASGADLPTPAAVPAVTRSGPSAADTITREETPRVASSSASTLRVASWNIAGLRGLLKRPAGIESLQALVANEQVDLLLLQETKLQEHMVAEVEPALLNVLNTGDSGHWRAAWACSTARKGYSGVATLWTDRHSVWGTALAGASCESLPVDPEHEAGQEGRALIWNLPLPAGDADASTSGLFSLINVYTPNSGAELRRLDYRCQIWDERFRAAIGRALDAPAGAAASRVRHICVGGDLNVAVEDVDFFNPHEKRMERQAGTTPEERESMRRYTEPPLRLTDAFRCVHGPASGQYTYWSQRARNRGRNRGLRLDYFLLSGGLVGALRDVQHLHTLEGSDHCPVVMELDLAQLRLID